MYPVSQSETESTFLCQYNQYIHCKSLQHSNPHPWGHMFLTFSQLFLSFVDFFRRTSFFYLYPFLPSAPGPVGPPYKNTGYSPGACDTHDTGYSHDLHDLLPSNSYIHSIIFISLISFNYAYIYIFVPQFSISIPPFVNYFIHTNYFLTMYN